MADFHYGLKDKDPISRVLFHNKDGACCGFPLDFDAKPMRQRIFVFWNPADASQLSDAKTLRRLYLAFEEWAERFAKEGTPPSNADRKAPEPLATGSPPRSKVRRVLEMQTSAIPISPSRPLGRAGEERT